jgi:hypothetical protein
MSNANNSGNEITANTNSNSTSAGMGRSVSSARFQIAKVFNNGTNTETSLGKAISIPHSMLQKRKRIIIIILFK